MRLVNYVGFFITKIGSFPNKWEVKKTKNKIKCACLALACAQAQDDRSASCLYPNMYMYISLLTNLSIQIIDGRAVDTHFALCVCVCVCVCVCARACVL